MTKNIATFVILTTLFISGCGLTQITQSTPRPANDEASALPTELPVSLPPADTTQKQTSSSLWMEVRDPRFGFGLAVPCWWLVTPTPDEGVGGIMTIKNFDETYFNANYTKGFWDWPNGSLKLELLVVEGIDPSLFNTDAYMTMVDPSMQGLVSSEERQIGQNTATVLVLKNMVNANDPDYTTFIYRLAAEKILSVNLYPQTLLGSPDIQALLASITLTPDRQTPLPQVDPQSVPLISNSCIP